MKTLEEILAALPEDRRNQIATRSHYLHDQQVWDFVKTSVTPLGQPEPPQKGSPVAPPSAMVSRRIDFHGMTLQEAHRAFNDWTDGLRVANVSNAVAITGKSGEIRREFPSWSHNHRFVRHIEELNGGGAFRVFVKR